MSRRGTTIKTFNYDETNPSATATAIQTWLNGFTADNGVSDATHATVNAIDPDTFVVDFGTATEGLDQSSLLQYVAGERRRGPPGLFAGGGGYESRPALHGQQHSRLADQSQSYGRGHLELLPAADRRGRWRSAPLDFPEPSEIRTTPYQTLAPYTEPVATTARSTRRRRRLSRPSR